jgi:hypothetical protein
MAVTFDRKALHNGKACVLVDGEVWGGFDALDLTIRTGDGKAWMESDHLTEGGTVMVPLIPQSEEVERNFLPVEACRRMVEDPSLIIIGVNRFLLRDRGKAVTVYNRDYHMQARRLRIEGFCQSVVVVPPMHKSLDAWVETHGKVYPV